MSAYTHKGQVYFIAAGEWYHLTPAFLHQLQRFDYVTDREVLSEFRRCRRELKQAKAERAAA